MNSEFKQLLAPRISAACLQRWNDGYFPDAAREALAIVELALKTKGEVRENLYGRKLISNLLGGLKDVKLRVPLGDELQEEARRYLDAVFSYYRNYAAHDGSRISKVVSARILIIASELLDLIDASELTLGQAGGIAGLVRIGKFDSPESLFKLLGLLDNYYIPEETYDRLFEEIALEGFTDWNLEALFELGLIEMHSAQYEDPSLESWELERTKTLECFRLTDLGREVIGQNQSGCA